jgi:hypothetical protein
MADGKGDRQETNMQIKIGFKDVNPGRFRLPQLLEGKIINAMRRRSFGVGMDYDRTMVNTDEPNRKFPPFQEDRSRVIDPTGALLVQALPVGIFSGNKPSYLDTLCVRGLREHLQEKGAPTALSNLSVYSQNSTWLQVFSRSGETRPEVSRRYARPYLIPEKLIERIRGAFIGPLRDFLAPTFMTEKPLIIRPEGTDEVHYAYGPMFENRGGVSLSWIAVPGDLRRGVIDAAAQQLDATVRHAFRFEPGGQFSIDGNHRQIAKHNGTRHFREEKGLSLLAYLGDSVYRKKDHVGNDLPVVKDPGAIVFAVNPDQNEIPAHERIVKAGVGPAATRAWLAWFLVTNIRVRFASEHLPDSEKVKMVDALMSSGLGAEFSIT